MNDTKHTWPIEAEGLVKTYRAGKSVIRAIEGIDLAAAPGQVLGLLGPNGAGKSTTVKVLTTLSRPDAGHAIVAGHDAVREPDRVRRAIGVVGQRAAVDLEATGRENLGLQGRLYGLDTRAIRDRSSELLARFSLTDAADRIVKTWSGGMQRKLDVAVGLIHRPQVLFLDEPTTGLDPEARADLWAEIGRLTADGRTVLLTTHYLDEADRLANQVAIIDRGRIVARGTPEALKAELRGDAVVVELQELPTDGHAAAALDAAGLGVATVTVARPSLDDVYFRHTGRTYRPQAQEAA
ncbi:MAG TPA: ATP-binding cassette domain-containing protein [Candidatus Limnocylindrales bacterium]|nr:ATP-binding cassette domain-containing protein [Candidatus Limnocylindrales bacterium]